MAFIMKNLLREVIPLRQVDCFAAFSRVKNEFDFPCHFHEEYELNFIYKARGRNASWETMFPKLMILNWCWWDLIFPMAGLLISAKAAASLKLPYSFTATCLKEVFCCATNCTASIVCLKTRNGECLFLKM